MIVVFYISGHGFGHATRDIEVINKIRDADSDARIVIRSAIPRAFLARETRHSVELEFCETDTGIVQIDSLRLDATQSAHRAAMFYRNFTNKVADEAELLRQIGAHVVVGDVPPLAFAAAAAAGVPSVVLANFTWDWIYEAYSEFDALAPGVIDTIRAAYARASIALRLPFAGGFEPLRAVARDIPLVARRSRLGRAAARDALQLDTSRPIVLVSFGGYGATLPFAEIAGQNDVTLVMTDHEARVGNDRVRCFELAALAQKDVRYEDLVAAADIVVSKPGYGIVSECIANDTALLYTARGPFVEEEVLVSGMKPFLRCGFIPQDDLRAGRWQRSIDELLGQPGPAQRLDTGGAHVAAEAILALADA